MADITINEDKSKSRIYSYLVEVDPDFIPPLNSRVDINSYAEKLSSNAINLFASIDGRDVGHAAFYADDRTHNRAFLTSLSVKSETRGKGVSAALMQEIKLRCRRADMTKIALEVDAENAAAIRFYTKAGFEFSDESDSTMSLELKR